MVFLEHLTRSWRCAYLAVILYPVCSESATLGVLSSFLPYTFLCLKYSVYCCPALALGAHNLDSSAIDLSYINREFLSSSGFREGKPR
jgi:hypothetical protein